MGFGSMTLGLVVQKFLNAECFFAENEIKS
jgi:hypothetical protein